MKVGDNKAGNGRREKLSQAISPRELNALHIGFSRSFEMTVFVL